MKIPFVGQSYSARSLNADAQRTLNCYLEMDSASPRAPVALYGTPGTISRFNLTTTGHRGAIVAGNYGWWVSGNKLYRADQNYAFEAVGSLNTPAGSVGMAANGTQILVVDGEAGYIANLITGVFTQITDPDFPNGVKKCTYQDGYFIAVGDGSGKFYINQTPGDGLAWRGTDFASAEGAPDNTICCISDHRELWLGGSQSFEVWVNTGNADFPFERSGNVFIQHGTAAADSLCAMDNTLYWLGQDENGNGLVYKVNGYTPIRISNHALEKAILSYGNLSGAIAFTYQQEGHSFYVITFPLADRTWVYDVSTEQWHERAWRDPATGVLSRWRANSHIFFGNKHLVGDYRLGTVYELNLDYFSDNGSPLLRLRSTQCLDGPDGSRRFYAEMQVDMETGVGIAAGQGRYPLLMMRYSNDGGHTWSNERTASVGAIGQYGTRAIFRRLGAGRNRVWEISMTDPVKFAVFGAFVNG